MSKRKQNDGAEQNPQNTQVGASEPRDWAEEHPWIHKIITIGGGIGFLAGTLSIWYWLGHRPMDVPSMAKGATEESARYGDSFGAVNSLFSALAFFGVIIALFWQKSELSLQRRQMTMALQEQKRSTEAQQKSEQRLLLAAYLNALDTERELANWRQRFSIKAQPSHSETVAAVTQARIASVLGCILRTIETSISEEHSFLADAKEATTTHEQCTAILKIATRLQLSSTAFSGLERTPEITSKFTLTLQRCHDDLTKLAQHSDGLAKSFLTIKAADIYKIAKDLENSQHVKHERYTDIVNELRMIAVRNALEDWG